MLAVSSRGSRPPKPAGSRAWGRKCWAVCGWMCAGKACGAVAVAAAAWPCTSGTNVLDCGVPLTDNLLCKFGANCVPCQAVNTLRLFPMTPAVEAAV